MLATSRTTTSTPKLIVSGEAMSEKSCLSGSMKATFADEQQT